MWLREQIVLLLSGIVCLLIKIAGSVIVVFVLVKGIIGREMLFFGLEKRIMVLEKRIRGQNDMPKFFFGVRCKW